MNKLIMPNNSAKLPPDGPAVFANASFVVFNGGAVRLVFLENIIPGVDSPKFRAAVIMPLQDVMALKNALVQICAQVQAVPIQTPMPEPGGAQ